MSEDTPARTIQFLLQCDVPQSALDGLQALLNDLVPLVLHGGSPSQLIVMITDDDQFEQSVNLLIGFGDRPGSYEGSTLAAAVPVVRGDAIVCSVVLGRSLVEPLRPELYHPAEPVSAVLEELLHTRLYALRWMQTGSASVPGSDSPPADVRICAGRAFDEYAVSALKAEILGTVPLVDNSGGFSVAYVQYGALVGQMLDEMGQKLPALIARAAVGSNYVAAWYEIIGAVYRLGFEPLAHDAGFRRGRQGELVRRPGDDPEGSSFYRAHVAGYWRRALSAMEQSLTNDLVDMESAIQEMGRTVTDFLTHVGVTFELSADGWHVYFDPQMLAGGATYPDQPLGL